MPIVPNKVSATLEKPKLQAVMGGIEATAERMAFLQAMTTDERRAQPRIGDHSHAFIHKALELGPRFYEHLPRSFDLDEMRKDVELFTQLFTVEIALEQLLAKVKDTRRLALGEAYHAARLIYRTGKRLDRAYGLGPAVDELAREFRRSTRRRDDDTDAAPPAAATKQPTATPTASPPESPPEASPEPPATPAEHRPEVCVGRGQASPEPPATPAEHRPEVGVGRGQVSRAVTPAPTATVADREVGALLRSLLRLGQADPGDPAG